MPRDDAHAYACTVYADLIDVMSICIDRHKEGLTGYDKLGELLALAVREFRRAGYNALDAEVQLLTRHHVNVRPR